MNDYKIINTEDGSFTVYSPLHTEACHSVEGARSETIRYYIEGCEILKKAQTKDKVSILEIGFGIGVGLQCTLECLEENFNRTNRMPHLTYISLEKDEFILNELFPKLIWLKSHFYPPLDKLQKSVYKGVPCLELSVEKLRLIILLGNARSTLVQLKSETFDAIFQDAFSLQKNPELWTIEWFKLLKTFAHDETILSTYSASSRVRKAMIEANWTVKKGLKFGNKRMSTRAQVTGETDLEILEKLVRSPVTPLKDSELLTTSLKSINSII